MDEKERIHEAYIKVLMEAQITKKVPQGRIKKVMQKAQDAFWAVVAKEFKEVEYGDMDPMQTRKMEQDMMDVINVWLENNYEIGSKDKKPTARDKMATMAKVPGRIRSNYGK